MILIMKISTKYLNSYIFIYWSEIESLLISSSLLLLLTKMKIVLLEKIIITFPL